MRHYHFISSHHRIDGASRVPAFECECKNKFSRRDNLFQHMRAKGCVVWYKDGVQQCEAEGDTNDNEDEEDADDLYVKRVMADAKIAQNKRDKASKQAWSCS